MLSEAIVSGFSHWESELQAQVKAAVETVTTEAHINLFCFEPAIDRELRSELALFHDREVASCPNKELPVHFPGPGRDLPSYPLVLHDTLHCFPHLTGLVTRGKILDVQLDSYSHRHGVHSTGFEYVIRTCWARWCNKRASGGRASFCRTRGFVPISAQQTS